MRHGTHANDDSATASAVQEADAQRALSERPSISIRARIALAFLICFLLMSGAALAGIHFISSVHESQQFLEKAGNFASEIQNARRYEKNFFLYKTNLVDGLNQVRAAERYLNRYADEMRRVIGARHFRMMKEDLARYEEALTRLMADIDGGKPGGMARRIIEADLRRYGSDLLAEAQEMVDRERLSVHAKMHTAKVVAIVAVVAMLLIMLYIAGFLTQQIVRPLGRFMRYTERIATGDYSPIFPRRKYRDEFSNLAMALNRMLGELKHNQEQLLQSRKMAAIGTLTSGIAHELNNPLNNIAVTTEVLIEDFGDYSDEEKLRMLHQIYSQVERSSGTVRNLLDFTRDERMPMADVSLRDVLFSTVRLVENEMTLNKVELETEIGDDLPRLMGNPRNLQQVFLNLFLNAIQAMPGGGTLRIRAEVDEEDDRLLRVDVTDTGRGIPEENLDRIFEPFFTTKEVGEGTGLGLTVTYGIIEKHGGRITATSEVDKGTTFSVFLPRQQPS
jgi:signal transduction histidine kinase